MRSEKSFWVRSATILLRFLFPTKAKDNSSTEGEFLWPLRPFFFSEEIFFFWLDGCVYHGEECLAARRCLWNVIRNLLFQLSTLSVGSGRRTAGIVIVYFESEHISGLEAVRLSVSVSVLGKRVLRVLRTRNQIKFEATRARFNEACGVMKRATIKKRSY